MIYAALLHFVMQSNPLDFVYRAELQAYSNVHKSCIYYSRETIRKHDMRRINNFIISKLLSNRIEFGIQRSAIVERGKFNCQVNECWNLMLE